MEMIHRRHQPPHGCNGVQSNDLSLDEIARAVDSLGTPSLFNHATEIERPLISAS